MNLYLDDNRAGVTLAAMLRRQGHSVVRPAEADLLGAPDIRHLHFAISQRRAVLTADRVDFHDLHDLVLIAGGTHPGILLVRFENDRKRDMKPKHIVRAVERLEQSGLALVNQVVILNHWR